MEFDRYEGAYLKQNVRLICGVDEAGRGPLAGPVAVGAVIPDLAHLIDAVNDSKKLSDKKRRILYPQIIENAIAYKTVFAEPDEIDRVNILNATKACMYDAVTSLFPLPEVVLIDAVKIELPYPVRALIHGDALSYCIAAASILAKVERDDKMIAYAEQYPEYGFEEHKGYGTAHHISMLKKYGPCPIHRRSFIKNFFPDESFR